MTRSAMLMASVWSCVTNTMAMRSRRCREQDFVAHLGAQLGIQIGERFVEQAHRRFGDQCAPERDALLLPPDN